MELVAVLDGDLSKGLQKFQIRKISLKIMSWFLSHLEVTFVYCFQNLLSSWWYTVFSSILKGNDIKVFLFCGLFVIHNKCWWVLCAHLEQFTCSHTISHTNAAWSALSAVTGLQQKRGHDMQLHPKKILPQIIFAFPPLTTAIRTLMPGQWLAGLTWEARLSAPSSRLPMCHLFNTIENVFFCPYATYSIQ